MSVARGQMSATHFNKTYPFQVAVLMPKDETRFFFVTDLERLTRFMSCAPVHRTIWRNEDELIVYCFSDQADAVRFAEIVGGERVDPVIRRRA